MHRSADRCRRPDASYQHREPVEALPKIGVADGHLAHVDATLRLFAPSTNPNAIPPKRRYRRSRYFPPGELSRRCLEILRDAKDAPVTALAIAETVMASRGLASDDVALKRAVGDSVLVALGNLKRRGAVIKSGTTRNAVSTLPKSEAG